MIAGHFLYASHPAGSGGNWEFDWDHTNSWDVVIGRAPIDLGVQSFVSQMRLKITHHLSCKAHLGPRLSAFQTRVLSVASAFVRRESRCSKTAGAF